MYLHDFDYYFEDLKEELEQVTNELAKLFSELEILKNTENKKSSTKENNIK